MQRRVCRQLRGQSQPIVRRLREAVDRAVGEGVCSSLVAIASRDSIQGQSAALGVLLGSYGSAVRVARVRGSVFGQDHRALLSATQQLLAGSGSADFLRNMGALEAELAQGFERGRPVVVVVEEMHEFCRREKQVLLYSLLDLLHRQKLLFVVRLLPQLALSRNDACSSWASPTAASSTRPSRSELPPASTPSTSSPPPSLWRARWPASVPPSE